MCKDSKITLYKNVVRKLKNRGVTLESMADTVYNVQRQRVENVTRDDCLDAVKKVMSNREALHLVLTGLNLDVNAEQKKLDPTLQYILEKDEGLYGVDENLGISLCVLFGTIAVTNYGMLDVHKKGLIASIDTDEDHVNVFLDDLVGAVCASAISLLAHDFSDGYDTKVVHD